MRVSVSLIAAGLAAAGSAVLLAIGAWLPGAEAAPVPTPAPAAVPKAAAEKVRLVEWATGLARPLAMEAVPGDAEGRLWVAEKHGRVKVLGKDGTVQGAPILDIEERLSKASEQGLLGLAFHPSFAKNALFYLHYTDKSGDTRVEEWRFAEGKGTRVREVFTVEQPWSNHNGGHLAFGPDGLLWIGMGDGGSAGDPKGNGQNPQALLGKMLRVDVAAEKPEPRITLHGLRNPWRYTFDRKTGDLYIGDVGQNRFEEVHVIASGTTSGNLGWDAREGFVCYEPRRDCRSEGLTPPVLVYPTGVEGCTVVGGHVYRGKAIPSLHGTYFYADYCTGLLRSFRWKGKQEIAEHWDWKAALDPQERLASIASFAEDADGELYVISLDGTIRKLVPR